MVYVNMLYTGGSTILLSLTNIRKIFKIKFGCKNTNFMMRNADFKIVHKKLVGRT